MAEACPCCVPTAPALPLPTHRECPQQGTGVSGGLWLVFTRLSLHDPTHDAQGALLPLPLGIASHTRVLQCCNTHAAGC